jgi:hypothetical protein
VWVDEPVVSWRNDYCAPHGVGLRKRGCGMHAAFTRTNKTIKLMKAGMISGKDFSSKKLVMGLKDLVC